MTTATSEAVRGLADALNADKAEHHRRVEIALFLSMYHAIAIKKLSHEQVYDLFSAAMQAHRLASVDDFLDSVIFSEEGTKAMRAAGGVDGKSLVMIALKINDEMRKSVNRFTTLTEMLKG
jgi:hypothetical protein